MLLYAVAIVALQDLAALEVEASAVAGGTVAIDRRIHLAQCNTPPAMTPVRGGIGLACSLPIWRIVVPLQMVAPIIHRGDPVSVTASGAHFDVTIDGIAEADAAPGTSIRVRDRNGGHLSAVVRPDGSLSAPGYNLP
ncbi:flagella basal body P-ring formation protein FlgA [Glacieibacterium megasporae]|uniref:flagella basal body P-ring formation protein FlgA n=1 Tax=Glacieibacterium megasporae TaxID=2835787 RepID=UPI001C1E1450|nr:flagella basal body P-ring formation protein FlgA [Polymorphobacter megasporae]UAJ08686.1 flagella basal body P-ring formation protein FlgA [Polymorphobacter megasporae]